MKASEIRDMEVAGAKQVLLKLVLLLKAHLSTSVPGVFTNAASFPSRQILEEDSAGNRDSYLPQDDLSSVLAECFCTIQLQSNA